MDDTKAAVQEVESSADGSADLANLTEKQWSEWEKTGELPSKEPKAKEETSTVTPATENAAEADEKTPSESSPEATRQDRKPSESEKRIKELLGKVKELEDENGKLKTPKAAAEAQPKAKPTMQDKNPDGSLKYPASDEGFEKYTDDLLDWRQDERDRKASAEKAEKDKTDRETKIAEIRKAQEDSFKAQAEASKKKHDDFEEVAYAQDIPIVTNSIPDQWLLRSPVGSEMLYYFGQNKAELKRINGLPPDDQLRELVKLEDKLSEPAANKVTRASKPPSEVGARSSATTDPLKAAVENEDYEAFKAQEDARDIARLGVGRNTRKG